MPRQDASQGARRKGVREALELFPRTKELQLNFLHAYSLWVFSYIKEKVSLAHSYCFLPPPRDNNIFTGEPLRNTSKSNLHALFHAEWRQGVKFFSVMDMKGVLEPRHDYTLFYCMSRRSLSALSTPRKSRDVYLRSWSRELALLSKMMQNSESMLLFRFFFFFNECKPCE